MANRAKYKRVVVLRAMGSDVCPSHPPRQGGARGREGKSKSLEEQPCG